MTLEDMLANCSDRRDSIRRALHPLRPIVVERGSGTSSRLAALLHHQTLRAKISEFHPEYKDMRVVPGFAGSGHGQVADSFMLRQVAKRKGYFYWFWHAALAKAAAPDVVPGSILDAASADSEHQQSIFNMHGAVSHPTLVVFDMLPARDLPPDLLHDALLGLTGCLAFRAGRVNNLYAKAIFTPEMLDLGIFRFGDLRNMPNFAWI